MAQRGRGGPAGGEQGREVRVRVPGGEVVTYSYGRGPRTLVVISGGPGCSCDYIRDSHKQYAKEGFRVVAWDQLGTGKSDAPTDRSLWNIPRFVAELEAVRQALKLGKISIVGHSWGGVLGLEYTLAHPTQVRQFVLANMAVSIPLLNLGFKQCKIALGVETAKMISLREGQGTTSHPEYQAAATLLSYRHMCRTHPWPAPVVASLAALGPAFPVMFGPHLYHCTGTLATWDRTADLHRVKVPVLVTTGEHDYVLPEYVAIAMNYLPNAKLKMFEGCGHMPFFENPRAYHREVLAFLRGN